MGVRRLFLFFFSTIFLVAVAQTALAQRGGRAPESYGGWFTETVVVPGNPKLEVTFSKASTDKKVALFMFTGCEPYARPQVEFFSDVSRKANRAGIHTVIWNSAEARDEEDHCRGKVSLNDRLQDAQRVKKHLQEKGIATKFLAIGESQGANLLTRLSSQGGWDSFIAIMPHCDRFAPGGKGKMIVFAGDKDDAAPGAACAKWNAEVHRGADAYHGWPYPRHIGGAVFVRPDGKSSPKLYNAELAKKLDQRIDQWFQETTR